METNLTEEGHPLLNQLLDVNGALSGQELREMSNSGEMWKANKVYVHMLVRFTKIHVRMDRLPPELT